MAGNVKGIGKGQPQLQAPAKDTPKAKGSSQVVSSDEQANKMSKHGVEFNKRFKTGAKQVYSKFVGQADLEDVDSKNWESTFKEVIGDILGKSGLDEDNIIDFAFKSYQRFLHEHPEEQGRVQHEVVMLSEEIKSHQNKKSHI